MRNVTIDNLPADVLLHILNSTNHWSLINATHVSKKWRDVLTPALAELKKIYESHIKYNAESLVKECLGSTKITQVIFMADKLLTKLTLDQVVRISCSSYSHAEIVLQSKLFQDRPVHKDTKKYKALNDSPNSVQGVFDHFLSSFNQIEKLHRIDLLTEELNECAQSAYIADWRNIPKSSTITSKFLCQAYIARAIAEQAADNIQLVATYAKHTLRPSRLVTLARLSIDHTKAILKITSLLGKLRARLLDKIASASEENLKILYVHSINFLASLPIKLAKAKPVDTRNIAIFITKDTFFLPTNPAWKNWLQKEPVIARHILEIKKTFSPKTAISCILVKLMELSIEHAKAILSVNNVKFWLPDNMIMLKELASRNEDYHSLITDFHSNKGHASGSDIEFNFDGTDGSLITLKITKGMDTTTGMVATLMKKG